MESHKKEIEVRVEPNSSSLRFYKIHYRPKKRFNLFNTWRTLVEVWDGANLSFDQPVLFDKFETAVEFAKKLKEDPTLIDQHYERENARYEKSQERRRKEREGRNKSITL